MRRPIGVLLLLAGIAGGAPGGSKAWKGEERRLGAEETRYWRDLTGRLPQTFIDFRAELEKADAKPDDHKEATHDYAPWRKLYDDYLALARERGKADLALATSGDEKALPLLFDELLDLCKRIDALDAEIEEARPKVRYYVFEPRLGIERTGLARRLAALIEALAQCPASAPFLAGEGWKRGEKADGRSSVTRRVALLDTLARTDNEQARLAIEDQLVARSTSIRVAAVEALARLRAAPRAPLAPLLADPSPIVRRALLQAVRAHAAGDGSWIEPVLAAWEGATGQLRDECVLTLGALTNQKFGHDRAKWKEWFEIYREEIAGGSFDAARIEVQEATPAPAAGGLSFYGRTILASGVVFVLEGTQFVAMPADWEVQRTEYRDKWPGLRTQWEEKWPSHWIVLQREMAATLEAMPKEMPYGIVTLGNIFVAQTAPERGLFSPGPSSSKQALKLIERMPLRGWCSQFEGIRVAARMGGLDPAQAVDLPEPKIDTIVLLGPGDPAGGCTMTPEATVEAFRRFNRFRRLVVHTIRTNNEKEASEILMRGLAEASGGTYAWQSKPPG